MSKSLVAASCALVAVSGAAHTLPSSSLRVVADESLPRVVIDGDEYTATPNGYVLSHCVFNVPHNAESRRNKKGELQVFAAEEDGGFFLTTVPTCKPLNEESNPVLRPNRGDVHSANVRDDSVMDNERRQLQLPADYNGWLQYTAYHNETGFDVFTSVMSVPDVPASVPQILYLFPGLQNIDWIPKVDPEPKTPFDIIQPVLQYPYFSSESNGKGWGVRSWYVTVDEGALVSPEKYVKPGDSILCNMTRTGADSWFIGSKISSSGVETNQKATATRLTTQPWAYNTVECYGCRGCSTYPDNEFTISECEISSFTAGSIDIEWESNPKPAVKTLCNEKTIIKDAQTVEFSFQ